MYTHAMYCANVDSALCIHTLFIFANVESALCIHTLCIVANVDNTHVDIPCFPKHLNIQYMAAIVTTSTGQLQLP